MSYFITYDDAHGKTRALEFGSRLEAENAFVLLAGRNGNTGASLAECTWDGFRTLLKYGTKREAISHE